MRYLYSICIGVCFGVGITAYQWVASCHICYALEPQETLVLANKNAARSVGLAKYYMEKRGIPEENLLQLWMNDEEVCAREDYEKKVAGPVRSFLKREGVGAHIRCLVIMYGLPLRIAPPRMTQGERGELENLKKREELIKKTLENSKGNEEEKAKGLKTESEKLKGRMAALSKADQGASLDSEIALALLDTYPLSGWVFNPFFVGNQARSVKDMPDKGEVLMVSRLDGPSDEIVRRIIDEGIETEKAGLKGAAYFDARWPKPTEEMAKKSGMGYGLYDQSIHKAAERVRASGKMKVVVNDRETLFQPGECPDAALYCGWYSLGRYVDAFIWQRGSVGYHIASAECQTLKRPDSQVWCKRMLEKGVAATIGPVSEPYVQAFPIPEIFFGLLMDGYWTLAECYALSQPFWSWQMVLVGDPLYRPFRNRE